MPAGNDRFAFDNDQPSEQQGYRIFWAENPHIGVIGSFDDLPSAIEHAGTLRTDWHFVIVDRDGEQVWPKGKR